MRGSRVAVPAAATPARSRHCNGELFRRTTGSPPGKERSGEDPEPGNLPVRLRTATFGRKVSTPAAHYRLGSPCLYRGGRFLLACAANGGIGMFWHRAAGTVRAVVLIAALVGAIALPGGDYARPGCISELSRAMEDVMQNDTPDRERRLSLGLA